MRLWQRAMIPPKALYESAGTPALQKDLLFEAPNYPLNRNLARRGEGLLLSPQCFKAARVFLATAHETRMLTAEAAREELEDMAGFEQRWWLAMENLSKLKRGWQKVVAGGLHAEARQRSFLELLNAHGGLWQLPLWMAWGTHAALRSERALREWPYLCERARIDEENGFLIAANLDYGSFNFRVCALINITSRSGGLSVSVAQDLLRVAKEREGLPGWGLSGSFWRSPTEMFNDGEAPAALAALEATSIGEAMGELGASERLATELRL